MAEFGTPPGGQARQRRGFPGMQRRKRREELFDDALRGGDRQRGQRPQQQPQPQPQQPQLGQQVSRFLGGQLQQAGQDPVTQAQMGEYEAGVDRSRQQQIEQLQRFGVLGGEGVSSGRVADVMGEFESGVERGRAGIRSQAQQRLLGQILPQATQFATAQAQQQAQQRQFAQELGQRGRQFGLAQELEREQLAQQAGQFGAGQVLEREQLGQQQQQFTAGQALEQQRLAQQQQQIGGGQALERER